jgi:hypothetical protein
MFLAMKERYMAEAKFRKRQAGESLRDFGQALEDLNRRAYPETPDIVKENAIKVFLDKCGQSEGVSGYALRFKSSSA